MFLFVSVGVSNRDKNSSPLYTKTEAFLPPPARASPPQRQRAQLHLLSGGAEAREVLPEFFSLIFVGISLSQHKCCEGLLLHPRVMLWRWKDYLLECDEVENGGVF